MSAPDIYTSAAQFFFLAGQALRLPWWRPRMLFWEMSASSSGGGTGACLPALAAAVRRERHIDVLRELALHPLPVRLSRETVPWYDSLVASWEVQRLSNDLERQNIARLALVRLDGCGMPNGMTRPSRLPEWLAEARRVAGSKWRVGSSEWRVGSGMKLEGLAALANWRPAPGVITPPETLREWLCFWAAIRQSSSSLIKGIACKSLLNLPEPELQAASLPPRQLLRQLTASVRVEVKKTRYRDDNRQYPLSWLYLLNWRHEELTGQPVAELAQVARTWLDVAADKHWICCHVAWSQLIQWNQAGSLAICGIDLLPFLARAVPTKEAPWAMAQWTPVGQAFTPVGKPDGLELLRELETSWRQQRQAGDWLVRASAWLAGIRLHQAGLATEPLESFGEAYLSAVAHECNEETLLVLAQWSPDATFSAAFHQKWHDLWQGLQKDEDKKQVAEFALLRQVLERGDIDQLRCLALEGWRTGTKKAIETPLVFITSRIHEVRAALAAGSVPDFDFEAGSTLPDGRPFPQLVLPPGHITNREWRIENEELKMENVENREVMQKMANYPAMHGLSR